MFLNFKSLLFLSLLLISFYISDIFWYAIDIIGLVEAIVLTSAGIFLHNGVSHFRVYRKKEKANVRIIQRNGRICLLTGLIVFLFQFVAILNSKSFEIFSKGLSVALGELGLFVILYFVFFYIDGREVN